MKEAKRKKLPKKLRQIYEQNFIRNLLKRGHTVKVISYDRGYDNLKDDFDAEKIFGLHFHFKNNSVKYVRTVINNLLKSPQATRSIRRVLKIIDEYQPQIIFTDFEPISYFIANLRRLPVISIDNQHRITNTKIQYPIKYKKEALASKAVINFDGL